ncbi:MAG: DEAD/DEAH box helicase, partial [Candidatus Aenigmarchaeota archaeon]|nr:DEAD/DEAH box helicase [Candidatus Aenigmarchaeota archaeon]MDI6722604.1 DEAD/DEAH box helicase [Candidatus Aenigmarchaeota archaeon]
IQNIEHRKGVQALVLAPTRELADQITKEMIKFSRYIKINICEIYGGVSMEPQTIKLRRTDVIVGTPGRILDHMRHGNIDYRNLKILVFDEADRMLDMGFIDDIKLIVSQIPRKRQTLMFSATIPDELFYITKHYMMNPVRIRTQSYVPKHKLKQLYYDARQEDKISLLAHLLKKEKPRLAIVFCGTRTMTDIVAHALEQNGIDAKAIHGGHTQSRRTDILEGFHAGRMPVLVATDVAARGLDIKNVTHIFNYDCPKSAEDYTHRIGRTARIGAEGKAITLLSSRDHEAFRKIVAKHEIEKGEKERFPLIRFRMPERRSFHPMRRRFSRR